MLTRTLRSAVAPLALLLLGACATTGATLGSGVGDRLMQEPPYTAGRRVAAGETLRVAHLPIAYQRGASQEPVFEPREREVAALLAEMNAYLDSLGVSSPVLAGARPRGTAPDVHFGCEQALGGECVAESGEVAVQGRPWMKLAVGRPSPSWVLPVRAAMDSVGAGAALVVTLEVGEYWVHQKNLRGDKEVLLGEGHSARLPWLTSLDQPVQVLQLTGALVDGEGRALRIGAEGILARRTHVVLAALGARETLSGDDVERARTLRRGDLPGEPLAWRVALRSLVAELTGDGRLALSR